MNCPLMKVTFKLTMDGKYLVMTDTLPNQCDFAFFRILPSVNTGSFLAGFIENEDFPNVGISGCQNVGHLHQMY